MQGFGIGPMDPTSHFRDNTAGNGSAARRSSGVTRPVYSVRVKLLVVAVIAAAIGAFVLAYMRTAADDNDQITSTGGTNEFVDELVPARGSQVLQQATVAIRVTPGWEAAFEDIGGRRIPPGDVLIRPGLDTVEFTPGPDKVWEALPAGRVCARASVWQIALGQEEGTRGVSWCFNVL